MGRERERVVSVSEGVDEGVSGSELVRGYIAE